MKQNIAANDFHEALAREVFATGAEETDVLCLMLLLHACNLALTDDASISGGVRGFAPITTRHVAETAASLFPSAPKSNPSYWYDKWNGEWKAYAILEEVPDELKRPLAKVRDLIESHPWVRSLQDEDWDIIEVIDAGR